MRLHATGATTVRARISRTGPNTFALALADPAGSTIATVESVALRPVDPAQLRAASTTHGELYEVVWQEIATPAGQARPRRAS